MKKKFYSSPDAELMNLVLENVITASGDPEDMVWQAPEMVDELPFIF